MLCNQNRLKVWFKESQPFFFCSLASSIKEYSIPIGSFFGMKDVVIYDLANKIIIVPRTIYECKLSLFFLN